MANPDLKCGNDTYGSCNQNPSVKLRFATYLSENNNRTSSSIRNYEGRSNAVRRPEIESAVRVPPRVAVGRGASDFFMMISVGGREADDFFMLSTTETM